jgi:tol-pal system protein YbgF
MQNIKKLFVVASGLVILTSPLCIMARAQGYVDVEAERAAAEAAGSAKPASAPAADPYAPQPAQVYPATSYGTNTAPPASTTTSGVNTASAPGSATPPPSSGGQHSGQNLGNLFLQIQQLQQEVMRLNGKVEEQAYALQKFEEQGRQRYLDIDKRLGGSGDAAANTAVGPIADTGASPMAGTSPTVAASRPSSGGAQQPGEGDAYQAAYSLVLGRQFEQAIPAFQQFLREYPEGKYVGNAHYWLGELYLVMNPPDLESARQSFALLLSEFPENAKAPDALYKLGTVQFMKGNSEKAREYLDLVIRQYGDSNSAVVQLARDFIAENY